ncbi:hypothetical protein A2334_01410 [Candidatus Roizmanbacteria bacterium RIFOXYB2_FULL_38_10]|uniref:Carboxypeptidase regulatory-like domain-containing protein n=1 Tax=Candidatus Roizmanbacteria bacterium RIFOXYD1_FULL_38_12 TaxID=1802093 RepID=A0A1F7L288_9BACT|nr:MAG: hypothetical protein A3K47_05650 [Candidatus Roizmanbacteria bacterium RIFOXYA2_FULL_38_14]OGK64228.1 MAG: hypothetical protein A3K27_05650 [Candidatus Roizmanbacteria bacterium RIFOXYA1_FULL_37_12]OGK66074.1 MAG: hypothetical protein A3K38_05650 [Candidatus Roizmanbacteria bacterium RIFOXYB1_FULL_40_23]OGK68507.1 MAG: hypothetical protein A2334_01410 [Candidatus Roizmanbacteria bacterium RIFOXYB2_FULL_38_10]OGK70479.1 MAG: hypothetical protein A3K21_05655 [Candidatus Roizmanbacteria ba
MEQHPIPRQITSFEYKLIGFMTLKQFIYLVIFILLAYTVYAVFPIPLLNILLAIGVGLLGIGLAFVPINDRPLDVWIRNFWRRLTSPTQYFYHKNNPPISIFQNLYFVADPHRVVAHVESAKMLSKYLASTKQVMIPNMRKQQIQKTVISPLNTLRVFPPSKGSGSTSKPMLVNPAALTQPVGSSSGEKKPFFVGEIKNNKHISLPGILIYVKDINNTPVRLLKTNPHGIFATYNPLPMGEYSFEMKDPKNIYFFDTMKIQIKNTNKDNIEIMSREML